MKYYIIPTGEIAMEVEAEDKYGAMNEFALKADFDLNVYFKAVTEEEYHDYLREREAVDAMNGEIEFMADELMGDPDLAYPEDVCYKIAALAYKIYCKAGSYPYCDIVTEYDAINRAVEEYNDGKEDGED